MSVQILPPTTAGIHPENFATGLHFAENHTSAVFILLLFIVLGFALRVNQLGAESFGEDELNKLETIQGYRNNGLSGKNGEHPFLMKGLQWLSIAAAERINASTGAPSFKISDEAAIRFPLALTGTLITLLIFLLVSELFGRSIGLISAIFWAVEPMAISFDRIGKEDSLVLFFFLLTNLFWIRGQTAAEKGEKNWVWHVWATAAAFAGLMASKYYPFLLGISGAYYVIFQQIPGQKWAIGGARWPKFFFIMGLAFIFLNPTIVLPDTWREMFKFSSEGRIAHDSYEYLGHFYRNQVSYWLAGVPCTFYYVFIAVKTSLSALVLFLIGVPFIFKRRLGDGRFFILFWAFFWFLPFTVLGGKFTRYFTLAEPLILISAAVGFYYCVKWISDKFAGWSKTAIQAAMLAVAVAFPLYDSIEAVPHFRMFTNAVGVHFAPAGSYFPHDEFYDASSRDVIGEIARLARPNAVVACETPELYLYYARKIERDDLTFISLSDKSKVSMLEAGDFIAVASGRRYISNIGYIEYLQASAPVAQTAIMGVVSAQIYQLDADSLQEIRSIAEK